MHDSSSHGVAKRDRVSVVSEVTLPSSLHRFPERTAGEGKAYEISLLSWLSHSDASKEEPLIGAVMLCRSV